MNLSEFFSTRIILEKLFKHFVRHLLGAGAVDLEDLLCVGVVGVQTSELAFGISEEDEEVGAVASVDLLEHSHPRLLVHHAGEDDMLDRVHDDRTIGLGGRLAVESVSAPAVSVTACRPTRR